MSFNKLEWQRKHRKNNRNRDIKVYEKTLSGFLMRTYRNMKSRVEGIQKNKAHLYSHCSLISKDTFYTWSISNFSFLSLFLDWKINSHDQRLTPSIDRIDTKQGYELHNMQWITHSENSRKGAISRHANSSS